MLCRLRFSRGKGFIDQCLTYLLLLLLSLSLIVLCFSSLLLFCFVWFWLFSLCRLWLWLWYLPLSKKQIDLEKIKITNWKKRNGNLIPFWGSEPRFKETGRFWCEPGRQFRFHTGLTNQVLNKLRGRTIKTVR